jgi:phosphoglycerate kinase
MLNQISNKRVLVRVCYDISSLEQTSRIKDSLETVFTLLSNNNKVILLTHWGRPKGQERDSYSLKKQVSVIQKEINDFEKINLPLKPKISILDQYSTGFERVAEVIKRAEPQSLFILENTRFHPEEKSKEAYKRKDLAEKYASLADYFIDEAFPVSHRKEATNAEIKEILPFDFGISYQAEVDTLSKIKESPAKPFVLIMGGAKLETKLPLIKKLLPITDTIIVAGLLSFTFVKAGKELGLSYLQEVDIGDTLVEEDFLDDAKSLLTDYPEKIVLPFDYVYDYSGGKKEGVDTGPESLHKFIEITSAAKTIFWNGPIGFYEKEPYNKGTLALAKHISNLENCYKVAGGGDITTALPTEIISKFSFASMGGGATLEFLAK